MTKSWATKGCPGTYKNSQIKVLRNLGLSLSALTLLVITTALRCS